MKRAPSALLAIGGFGVAVAVLSVVTTAAIVLLTPQPPASRTSVAEIIVALGDDVPGFERRHMATPPDGTRVPMLEQMIASGTGRPVTDVRVVWLDTTVRGTVRMLPAASVTGSVSGSVTGSAAGSMAESFARGIPGSEPGTLTFFQGPVGTLRTGPPEGAIGGGRSPFLSLPLPAFSASVREGDGRWLTVRPARTVLGRWQVTILLSLGVSLLLLAPIAWLFARRLTRPFRALAGALDGALDGATEGVPEGGPRELREAAAAITSMRRRLAEEASERARMLTAIAHDLRTPLTGLRLRVETAPEPQRGRMIADVERMQAMIGEVLTFARHEAAAPERVEVRAILADIVAETGATGGTIRLIPGEDGWVRVPPLALRRAIENLVRNAIDYAGDCVIALQRSETEVLVSVLDSGPGIRAGDRERLLLPFERGDASRNRGTGGAGLGLSIVRDFAAGHRGGITLGEAAGGGTVATLRLPAA